MIVCVFDCKSRFVIKHHLKFYENLNTLVDKGYLKQIVVDKQSFYDTNTSDHIHVYNQEENRIYDYDDCKELHKDLPIPACLSLLEEYSLVINLKKKK